METHGQQVQHFMHTTTKAMMRQTNNRAPTTPPTTPPISGPLLFGFTFVLFLPEAVRELQSLFLLYLQYDKQCTLLGIWVNYDNATPLFTCRQLQLLLNLLCSHRLIFSNAVYLKQWTIYYYALLPLGHLSNRHTFLATLTGKLIGVKILNTECSLRAWAGGAGRRHIILTLTTGVLR